MLQSVAGYLRKRQKGFAVLASFAGGAWLLTSYARQRFKDLSERMALDSSARKNLRQRFVQNQEDCNFVLLAQLPTLARQILEELDVEALTAELQRRAEATKRDKSNTTSLELSNASLDNSQTLQAHDENDKLGSSFHSTLEAAQVPLPQEGEPVNGHIGTSEENNVSVDPRSKAELWQAIKLQTFHRTITTIYLVCLLALQTHIQLNLLGRHNYIHSVYEQACPEDDLLEQNSLDSLLDGSVHREEDETATDEKKLDPVSEREYLSFGWWFMQRGWKSVSELVQQAVEDSVGPISLKAQFGSQDFNKLLLDVRRKVEYEATGAVHSFSQALFPSTPEEEQETLMESGLQYPSSSQGISPQLRSLLNETQDFIDSPDFSIVLRSCLDQSFELLSSSLAHLFVDMPDVSTGRFEEVPEKKVRLAAILPALARASHSVLEDSPNEFADALASNRELQEFSAVVFSHFVLE